MDNLDVDGSLILKYFIIKPTKCNNDKIIFLHPTCHNSNMFRFTLIVFRDLIDIDKTYVQTWIIKYIWSIKCVKIIILFYCIY